MINYSLSIPPGAPSDGDLHAILIALQGWRADPVAFKVDAMGYRVVTPYSRGAGVWGVCARGETMDLVWGRFRLEAPDLLIEITGCTDEAQILAAYRQSLAFVGAAVRDASRTMLDAVAAAERQPK